MRNFGHAIKRKRFWVVRAIWTDNPCHECVNIIQDQCEDQGFEVPQLELFGTERFFFVPYGSLEAKCSHEDSSHKGQPVVKSYYLTKESQNGKTDRQITT